MNDVINLQIIFTSLITAVLTSFISVNIALRKYKSEQWWDKKLNSYMTIIEALNNMMVYCDLYIDVEFEGRSIFEINLEKYKNEFNSCNIILNQQVNIGSLLFSNQVCKVLLKLSASISSSESITDMDKRFGYIRCEISECLNLLVPYAKQDLKVTNSFLDK